MHHRAGEPASVRSCIRLHSPGVGAGVSDIWIKISGAAGAKVYNLMLGMATLALTARLLGPEGRGEVAAVIAWVALFCTVGHLSLGSVAIHQLAIDRSPGRIAELLGSLAAFATCLTVLGWLVAAGLFAWRDSGVFGALPGPSLALGFLILPFLIWEQFGQSLLMGVDRANQFNRALMLGRTVNLICVYAMVGWLAWGTKGAIGAALVASIVTAAGGLRELLRQAGGSVRASLACVGTLAHGSMRLHLNAIGTYLFSSSGILVVNHFHGAGATGNYQIASQLIGIILIIPNAITQVLYGTVTKLGPDRSWPMNRRVLHRSMAITLAVAVCAWPLAPYMIRLVAGGNFEQAHEYFRLMLPMLLGATLSAAMAPQWIGRGYFWRASLLTLLVGLSGFTLSVLLTPRLGVEGAIYGTLVAYAIGAIFNAVLYGYCTRRLARVSKDDDAHPSGQ